MLAFERYAAGSHHQMRGSGTKIASFTAGRQEFRVFVTVQRSVFLTTMQF